MLNTLMRKSTLSFSFKSRCFLLWKWRSKSSIILKSIAENVTSDENLSLSKFNDTLMKTLEFCWNPHNHGFYFQTHLSTDNITTTQIMISQIARTFDPLEWLSPISIVMKAFIQKFWIQRIALHKWNKLKQ